MRSDRTSQYFSGLSDSIYPLLKEKRSSLHAFHIRIVKKVRNLVFRLRARHSSGYPVSTEETEGWYPCTVMPFSPGYITVRVTGLPKVSGCSEGVRVTTFNGVEPCLTDSRYLDASVSEPDFPGACRLGLYRSQIR